jgi:hypothetical protein
MAAGATPASAQATRTWVSGVGDDVNPCSRTAPCKTFAGAISKTAAAGEINCLDPGGFGAVTITKSITILCDGTIGGVLASGVNGVVVNAAATDSITLSGLDIEGVSTGLSGVNFLAGGSLTIRNSRINGFRSTGSGVNFTPSATSSLFISDTKISNSGVLATTGGITVKPGAAGAANVHLTRVVIEGGTNGVLVDGSTSTNGVNVHIGDSSINGQTTAGVAISSIATKSAVTASVNRTKVTGAVTALSANGAAASGAGSAIIRAASSQITGNITGISAVGSGSVRTGGDNQVAGNGGGEVFSAIEPLK